jgi:xanthine dehydrogenase YagR molybdenum-binding subunit
MFPYHYTRVADERGALASATRADTLVRRPGQMSMRNQPACRETHRRRHARPGCTYPARESFALPDRPRPCSFHANAATFAEAAVDARLSPLRVHGLLGLYDASRIVPADNQAVGAMVGETAIVPLVHTGTDVRNRPIPRAGLADHPVSVNADVPDLRPRICVARTARRTRSAPRGSKR